MNSFSGRTFAIGDIHGAHLALEQCLERSGFDRQKDLLITIGDICDGWPYVYECVERLLQLDTINVIGNHDAWFRIWLETTTHPDYWWQGGYGTAVSYLRRTGNEHMIVKRIGQNAYDTSLLPDDIPPEHHAFFKSQQLYYLDDKKRLFVHAGFDRLRTLKEQQQFYARDFYWNRKLIFEAIENHFSNGVRKRLIYKEKLSEIFLGHTATCGDSITARMIILGLLTPLNKRIITPMNVGKIWNLDTGAGSFGKLTIMDIDTHEYWQSDPVQELYPNEPGR